MVIVFEKQRGGVSGCLLASSGRRIRGLGHAATNSRRDAEADTRGLGTGNGKGTNEQEGMVIGMFW